MAFERLRDGYSGCMRPRHALLAIAASVLLAGCGDDDDPITAISTTETTPESSAPTEDFAAAADSRCAEANAAIANLSSETTASSTSVGQQLEITNDLLDGIRSLDPPSDPALDSYFAAVEEQISILEQQESAAASGDTATVDALAAELDAAQSDALTAATEFGFEECGQEGTTLPESGDPTEPVPGAEPAPVEPVEPVEPVPVEPVEPVEPAPVEPVEPAPAPTPPSGGTGTGGGAPPAPPAGGSSGGIGPG